MKKRVLLSAAVLNLALNLGLLTTFSITAHATSLPAEVEGKPLPSLAPMLEKVLPAVVSIRIEGTQAQRQQLPPEFRRFFGPNMPAEQQSERSFQGLGSGVIIDAQKGYVLTNNHVINNASKIRGYLYDGREYEATLIGRDEQSDIALLQLKEAKNLVAIPVADSDALRVGDFAVAVGNPFGLGQTATVGIISALGRSGLNAEGLENFIQTDASINRGNSGGALVNLKGELIGINTAILAPAGGNIGIGFAIPGNMAKTLSHQLIEFGEVKRGLLGIKGSEMNSDIAKAFNINVQKGAFVREVSAGSAAAKAGVKAGDVIISLNDKPINSFAELRARIATTGPKKVKISLIREGKPLTLDVELQQSDGNVSAATLIPALQGAELTNGERKDKKGIVINRIDKNSQAEQFGLRQGDLIVAVNREPIETISQLRKILQGNPAIIALTIWRNGESLYLILR